MIYISRQRWHWETCKYTKVERPHLAYSSLCYGLAQAYIHWSTRKLALLQILALIGWRYYHVISMAAHHSLRLRHPRRRHTHLRTERKMRQTFRKKIKTWNHYFITETEKYENKEKKQKQERGRTAGTEFMLICCGWFIGEGARVPMGAWDICAFCIAIGLNWLIPMGTDTHTQNYIPGYYFLFNSPCPAGTAESLNEFTEILTG